VIASFADRALETLYYDGPGAANRGIPSALHRVLRRKLDQLNSAILLKDLRVPPGNRLEALKGNRQGQYSIRVNEQWRIVFRWHEGSAYEVAMVDYH